MKRVLKFTKAYIKSMRLYYSFITGIAGWIGLAYYEFLATFPLERTVEVVPPPEKKIIILVLLFLSWGINQIFNDFLGLKEDRINAPQRPMVTGELNIKAALTVSIILLLISALITWFYLEPFALIFLVAGALLNVIYEWAKGHGIIGNIVFGLMITMATLFGGYAAGPSSSSVLPVHRLSTLSFIFLLNALMTYYTYFKDYQGDKEAGKNTLVVRFGPGKSRWMAVIAAFLPTLLFIVLRATNLLWIDMTRTFIILGLLTVFLQLWTGVLYFRNPTGVKTYESLKKNFQACACGQSALVAFFNSDLAIWLFIMTYIFVGFLFDLYKNAKT